MADRRILFIDHETRLSGGQLILSELIEGLIASGTEVHLAVPGPGALRDAATDSGAEVHYFRLSGGLRTVSRWELARRPSSVIPKAVDIARTSRDLHRLVKRVRPDVVHTNSLKAHLLATPVTRLARVPQVWHMHDILAGKPATLVAVTALVGARRLVCISEATAAPLRPRLGRRVVVVYNGVPQRPADADAAQRFREGVGAHRHCVLVTMIGQIAQWKGQDVMIEAAKLVGDRTDLRFAIVGECLYPANEAEFEARVRIDSAALGDRLVWTGQVQPIEPVMAASDIVVHASRLPEPFGRVIVEAMAQGTPVISTDIGSGPELVPPHAGMLVPPDDPSALAAAVIELADDAERRLRMGSAARRAAAQFTTAAMVDRVEAVHDEVLSRA